MAGSTATASATVPPSAGGIHEHCSLTHVVNPTKFFIATQQMVDAHEVMKDALKSRFEDETPPRVGGRSRRFLVYIHGEFQRAEVEFGNPGSDDVLLIDVGRNVHVSLSFSIIVKLVIPVSGWTPVASVMPVERFTYTCSRCCTWVKCDL